MPDVLKKTFQKSFANNLINKDLSVVIMSLKEHKLMDYVWIISSPKYNRELDQFCSYVLLYQVEIILN